MLDCRVKPGNDLVEGYGHTCRVMRGLDPRIHDEVQRVMLDAGSSPAMTSWDAVPHLPVHRDTLAAPHTLSHARA